MRCIICMLWQKSEKIMKWKDSDSSSPHCLLSHKKTSTVLCASFLEKWPQEKLLLRRPLSFRIHSNHALKINKFFYSQRSHHHLYHSNYIISEGSKLFAQIPFSFTDQIIIVWKGGVLCKKLGGNRQFRKWVLYWAKVRLFDREKIPMGP